MSKEHEKLMTDLQRLLQSQDFKSEADLQNFMEGIMGKPIPSFPKEALNKQEQAQDLVFQAYDLPPAKGKIKIKKALELDPDCIEAYEYLASLEDSVEKAMAHYEKGINIGRRLFGGDYLKDNKGMFWGLHETRPYMRCLQQYADCLFTIGKVNECVTILEEMIMLNPNDNQGARDLLLLSLIITNENQKFIKYSAQYKEDTMAFAQFNRALFAFKTEGESVKANNQLKSALKSNKFIAKKLLSSQPIRQFPETYRLGSEDEATYYAVFAQKVWENTLGALQWLRKNAAL